LSLSPTNQILVGDAGQTLGRFPPAFVDCVITSPPYFRLRNYQHDSQLGLEAHVDAWVNNLRAVLTEIGRVLVPTGSVWLNLGDRYSTGREGAPAKSLLLGPERLALALIKDGWIVRNKSNPLQLDTTRVSRCTYQELKALLVHVSTTRSSPGKPRKLTNTTHG
jgi:site-specific DNA-methyltransferase (adenine-specific)